MPRRHQPITQIQTCFVCGTLCVSAPSPANLVNFEALLGFTAHVCRACESRGRLSRVDARLRTRATSPSHFHLHAPLGVAVGLERRGLLEEPCVPPGATDVACPVCQEDIDAQLDGVPATRACGHLLHRVCYARLRPKITSGLECPLCRTPITRHDLPFDTRASAVVHAHRLVCALLLERRLADEDDEDEDGAAAVQVRAHHVLLYNVCTRALCNALLRQRERALELNREAPSERLMAAHNRLVEQVSALDDDAPAVGAGPRVLGEWAP